MAQMKMIDDRPIEREAALAQGVADAKTAQ
jgi:hypothetical protein